MAQQPLINNLGLTLYPRAANPGGAASAYTLWCNSGAGNTFYIGSSPISTSGLPSGTTNDTLRYTGSAWAASTAHRVDTNGRLLISTGAVTTAIPAIDVSATWNNSSVTFTGIKQNITDTASTSASLLLDLQVGGVSRFSVNKNGGLSVNSPDGKIVITAKQGIQLVQGTIIDPYPSFDMSVTWNSEDPHEAISISVTDTLSDNDSTILNVDLGLLNVFQIGKRGNITSSLGTITSNFFKPLDMSATWNNASVTFTGIKQNITDTASTSASLLLDLQVNGTSKCSVSKAGAVYATDYLSVTHGTLAKLEWYNSSAAVDMKRWLLGADASGELSLQSKQDSGGSSGGFWTARRSSGVTPFDFKIDTVLNVSSAQVLSLLQIDLSGSTPGGDYVASLNKCIYHVNVSGGTARLVLPAITIQEGATIVVMNDTANAITVAATGSDTIRDISTGTSAGTFSQPARTLRTYVYTLTVGWIVG